MSLPSSPEKKVAVISGASDGIGLAIAVLLSEKGWIVYDFSRRGSDRGAIRHITADVTDENAIKSAFEKVFDDCGRIDALIANAGFGISGAVEFCAAEAVKRLFEVNVLGADSCARAAVPYMRRAGGGRILFTGSVAGIASIPFQTHYSATKAAVNSLAAGLANELRPFKIKVASIMLGDSKTGFTAKREKTPVGAEVYGGIIQKSVSRMERDEQNGMEPAVIARKYYKILNRKNLKPIYSVGFLYKLLSFLIKILPSRVVNRIVYMLYGR